MTTTDAVIREAVADVTAYIRRLADGADLLVSGQDPAAGALLLANGIADLAADASRLRRLHTEARRAEALRSRPTYPDGASRLTRGARR